MILFSLEPDALRELLLAVVLGTGFQLYLQTFHLLNSIFEVLDEHCLIKCLRIHIVNSRVVFQNVHEEAAAMFHPLLLVILLVRFVRKWVPIMLQLL